MYMQIADHFAVQQKRTQHWKATILQKKKTLNPFLLDFGLQYICAGINFYSSYFMELLKRRTLPEPFILQILKVKFREGMLGTCFWSHTQCSAQSLSHVQLFATLWTVARQAPLSMGFSRQEYWSGLLCPFPGELPDPGIEAGSPASQADSLPAEPPRKLS